MMPCFSSKLYQTASDPFIKAASLMKAARGTHGNIGKQGDTSNVRTLNSMEVFQNVLLSP
jgi:hypothetical protein